MYEGVIPNLKRRLDQTSSDYIREELGRYAEQGGFTLTPDANPWLAAADTVTEGEPLFTFDFDRKCGDASRSELRVGALDRQLLLRSSDVADLGTWALLRLRRGGSRATVA